MADDIPPSVGIFWSVPATDGSITLVIDRTTLLEAEPYGSYLTHPRGHYEVWEAWRRLGPTGLRRRGLPPAIAWQEYEECPRGRIVYDREAKRFVIYADRRLQRGEPIARIVEAFGLFDQDYSLQSDRHYR